MLHWLLTLGLVVFVVIQANALKRIESRLDALLRVPSEPQKDTAPRPESPAPAPIPSASPAPTQAAPLAEARRPERISGSASPDPQASAGDRTASDSRPSPRPRRSGDLTWAALSTWLAERGLAWLGGGGLALGGLLLVVYAARQGVFVPSLRIAAAVILGGLMVAASEWILRQKQAPGGQHRLAAAVAAGAGAVTLYGAVCAAYALYGLIPFAAAAVLAVAISLGLLALSLRHGEPLALLALFGALITPWVIGMGAWSPTVLQAYAGLVAITGFALSAVRLWGRAGVLTVAGLLLLSLTPKLDGGAMLLIMAAAGPACAVLWRRRQRPDDPASPPLATFLAQPAVALILTSVVSAHLWFVALAGAADPSMAALVAGILVSLGAAIVGLGMAPAAVFAVPVGVAVLAALLTLSLRVYAPTETSGLLWLHGLTTVIAVASLIGALRSPAVVRTTVLAVGGLGLALLASLSWPLLDQLGAALPWLPAALLSAGMFATASLIVRRTDSSSTDRGLTFWLAAAAELAFLSIHAAAPPHLEPIVLAGAALLLAFSARRLAWQGLAQASVAGGLLTLAMLFRTEFLSAALEGRLALPIAMAVSVGASALLFVGARLMTGGVPPKRNEAEAQATASLLVLLTGLFIGLHVLLSGVEDGAGSGGLFEGAMRTLLLLSAGVLLVLREGSDDGPIARWRTILVVGAGIAHAILVQGLVWNPWWGGGAPPLGLPVLNTLMLSFLAPAALLVVSGRRRHSRDAWAESWSAAGVLFAFLWVLLALRHLFHGGAMGEAGIGRAESGAYVVLLLLTGRVMTTRARRQWAGIVGPALTWFALGLSVLVFGYYASPWWGPSGTPLASAPHALLLFAVHAAAAVLMAVSPREPIALRKAATAGCVGVLFVLTTLLIRWTFQGADMGGAAPGSGLETWTYSTVWALSGLATLSLGAARKDATLRWAGLLVLLITAVKVLFFDLDRLEGVVRAASFLVVGALFLAGALAARRLNTRSAAAPDDR